MRPVSAVIARLFVVTTVAALLQLGASGMAAHADAGCNDETCLSLQCDMAAGNGCASFCGQAMAAPAAFKPPVASAAQSGPCRPASHHNLRLKDQPFRPPILA